LWRSTTRRDVSMRGGHKRRLRRLIIVHPQKAARAWTADTRACRAGGTQGVEKEMSSRFEVAEIEMDLLSGLW